MFALLGFADTTTSVKRTAQCAATCTPLRECGDVVLARCPQLGAAICAAHAGCGRSKSLDGQTGQLFERVLPGSR